MVRIKRGNVARKRRKKILTIAKGFHGKHSKLFRVANAQVMKALKYAYVGRKQKKRQFRKLWITRINATTRSLTNKNYSLFIAALRTAKVALNRKMLAQLAIFDLPAFDKLQLFAFKNTNSKPSF